MKIQSWPIASLPEARSLNTFRAGEEFRRRTNTGLARAAETLADALRARGLRADASAVALAGFARDSTSGAQSAPGGRAHVHIEGAGIVAREFGTLNRAASPVVAPVVRAHTQEIVRVIAAEFTR